MLAFATGVAALTWPVALAARALQCIYGARPGVVEEAVMFGLGVSIAVSGLATGYSALRPPRTSLTWVLRCSVMGVVVGDLWLAVGAFVRASYDPIVLATSMLGGLLYGAPVGLFAGVLLGAGAAAIHRIYLEEGMRRYLSLRKAVAVWLVASAGIGWSIWSMSRNLCLR